MTRQDDNATGTGFDRLLSFSIPGRHARGRVVRLGHVLDDILSAHAYPPALKHVLAEALTLTALMGGLLKDQGSQLTLQAQARGGLIDLLVCDYRDGELRGYVKQGEGEETPIGANPSLEALFGEGYLAITFDLASTGQRYQGVVPLEGESITTAVEHYFVQSEQVPTLIRTAIQSENGRCVAGGLLVQHLPEGEEGRERLHVRTDHPEWEHVAILAGSIRHGELVEPALTLEELVWRLFHEEEQIRVETGAALVKGCRCSVLHFEDVLSRFPTEDRKDMRDESGIITVDCAFCSRAFAIQD